MKIIFLGGNYNNPGGTERVSTIIANELSLRGYDILVVSTRGGDKPFFKLNDRVRSYSLFNVDGRDLFRAPAIIHRIRKLLNKENPDVLVAVETMLALFTIPATIGFSLTHICWEHFDYNTDLGYLGRKVARHLAARYCDIVVTLTEKDSIMWHQKTCHKAKIVFIHNPSPYPVEFKNVPADNNRVVLAIGRLTQQKGFDLLLAAWREISSIAPGWRLRIVGNGPDRDYLLGLVEEYSISSTVDFVEATNNVRRHYREAAIYCLSSRFEGFGMVLVEAMSFGVPIVSFDCDSGPAEILRGTNAILVQPEDVNSLSRSLLHLIENPEERKRQSHLLKLKAVHFQPEIIIKKWIAIIGTGKV